MTHNVDDAAHAKHVILRAQLGHGGMWTIYIKRGRENQFLERTFSPPNLLSPAMRARVHAHARARANALQDHLFPPLPRRLVAHLKLVSVTMVGPDPGPQFGGPSKAEAIQ